MVSRAGVLLNKSNSVSAGLTFVFYTGLGDKELFWNILVEKMSPLCTSTVTRQRIHIAFFHYILCNRNVHVILDIETIFKLG